MFPKHIAPHDTAGEVVQRISDRAGVNVMDGWALFQVKAVKSLLSPILVSIISKYFCRDRRTDDILTSKRMNSFLMF